MATKTKTVTVNATANRKTVKPSGLSITRSGGTFVASWKIADADYNDGQGFQYRRKGEKSYFAWNNATIAKNQTTKSIPFSQSSFYPNTKVYFRAFDFRVRGKRKDYVTTTTKTVKTKRNGKTTKTTTITHTTTKSAMSDWTTKTYVVNIPPVPSLSATLNETLTNVTTFSWNVGSLAASQWFVDCEWESVLVKESSVTNGSKLSWKSNARGYQHGTSGMTGSVTITEDTVILANNSYTRWVRVRSRGVAGASAWRYAKHVYARPFQAKINAKTVANNSAGGLNCQVLWTANNTAAHPIDITTVQYSLMTPAANLQPQSGASWTDALVTRDTSEKDKATFSIDDVIDKDQCLFVRVNTKHDGNTTYGIGTHVKAGALQDPTNLSVETNDSTYRATVSATNNSEVPDSRLAVIYKTKKKQFVVGIIPHGESSVVVQCPNWSAESSYSFGVYAFVGSATGKRYDSLGTYSYTMVHRMRSASTLWRGGTVPVAPENVVATPSTTSGTVTVTWDWSWRSATKAELSWADHEDAWESTDEPDTYEINNLNIARWNISGLETGQRWYIRVRLINVVGDEETFGPYSDVVTVNLASAPSIPVLVLSDSVITQNDSVTASWVYSTTDGTLQAYAEICECQITDNGITYGSYKMSDDLYPEIGKNYYTRSGSGTDESPYIYTIRTGIVYPSAGVRGDNPHESGWYEFRQVIAHANTAQHITMTPAEMQWETGRTYNLAVRVTSASGSTSDDWSTPVSLTIAEPMEIEITQTSLQTQTIEVNPKTASGSIATFDTPYAEPMVSLVADIDPIQDTSGGAPSPSNICPISGWDEVETNVTGVNVWDEEWEVGNIDPLSGANTSSTTQIRSKNYIPVKPNTTIYLYSAVGGTFNYRFYKADKTYLRGTYYGANQTLAIPEEVYYMRFAMGGSYGTTYNNDISINYPSTDHDYHAHQGQTYHTTLPQTVYGGTLDVVSGVLTVDRAMVDLGTEQSQGWYMASTSISGKQRLAIPITDISATDFTSLKSNIMPTVGGTNTYIGIEGISNDAVKRLLLYNSDLQTVADWKAWATANNLQACYPLANPQTYQLTTTQIDSLLGRNNVWSDSGDVSLRYAEATREAEVLTELPMTITVVGAGANGTTTVAIERAESYHIDRPDENVFNGYEGETVALISQVGESQITINIRDLIASLDDGAKYRIVATVQDALGQTAEARRDFEVHWNHQALMPEGTLVLDDNELIARITPVAPTGTLITDACDIYRLSTDKPELIVQNAQFGTEYVDPYPAFGQFGGHRIVFKTVYGDYITAENKIAWVNLGADNETILETPYTVIDFDGGRVMLSRNVDVSSKWTKDFQETKYLGGAVQGDWNPAVSRTATIGAVALTLIDQDVIQQMRRLAVSSGICHVRTSDGSSYAADVQVSEDTTHDKYGEIVSFSLSITRVDTEKLDGMTAEEWAEMHSSEEE